MPSARLQHGKALTVVMEHLHKPQTQFVPVDACVHLVCYYYKVALVASRPSESKRCVYNQSVTVQDNPTFRGCGGY
eukprot:3320522-Amphidinium_carterae.1